MIKVLQSSCRNYSMASWWTIFSVMVQTMYTVRQQLSCLSLLYSSVLLVELQSHHFNPLGASIQNPVWHLHGCKKKTTALTYLLYPFCDAESCLYRMLYSTVWLMIKSGGWRLHSCCLKDLLLLLPLLLSTSCGFIWECVQHLHPEHSL